MRFSKDYELVAVDRNGGNAQVLNDAETNGPIRWELNQPGSFSFSVPVASTDAQQIAPLTRELQIWRRKRLIWWGVIIRTSVTDLTRYEVQCMGLLWYFSKRFFGRAARENWLQNGSFDEGNLRGWDPVGVTAQAVTEWGARPGVTYQANLDQQGSGDDTFITQSVLLPRGKVWTLSAWYHIRLDTTWVGPAYDGRGLFVERLVPDLSGVDEIKFDVIEDETVRGVFHRSVLQFTSPPDRETLYRVRLYATRHTNPTPDAPRPPGGIIWDHVQLVAMESSSWPYADIATILAGIISHAQDPAFQKSNLNITAATAPTGVILDRTYQHADHRNIGDALQEFADQGLCDFDITYDAGGRTRAFRSYAPRKGSLRGDLTLELGGLIKRVGTIDSDGSAVATNVVIMGEGNGPDREEAGAYDTSGTDGLVLESFEAAQAGTHHDLLPLIASERLMRRRAVVEIPQLTLDVAVLDAGVTTGDVLPVLIQLPNYSIDDSYRIVAMELNPESDELVATFNAEGTAANPQEPPTPDITPPKVISSTPSANATNISTQPTLQVVLNEQLLPTSIGTNTVTLKAGSTTIPINVAYDTVNNIVTATPISALTQSTTYVLRVKSGSSGVKDVAGNPLASDFTLTFTTEQPVVPPDTTRPTILISYPADNAANVYLTSAPRVAFSEALNPSTVTAANFLLQTASGSTVARTVTYDSGSHAVDVVPSALLSGSTSYRLLINGGTGGIRDLAGNAPLWTQESIDFTTTASSTTPTPTPLRVDYAAQTSTAATGYSLDYGQSFDLARGYGWVDSSGTALSLVGNGRERGVLTDKRADSFVHMQLPAGTTGVTTEGRWRAVLANDTYTVTVGVGDPNYTNSHHVIRANGATIVDYTPTTAAPTTSVTATVPVINGVLMLDATGGTNTKIAYVDAIPGASSGGGTTPPGNELDRPAYAGLTLHAQDDFTRAGQYSMSNLGPSWSSAAMNTTHPPSGAYYTPASGRIIRHTDGYLQGYFDESSTDIAVTCSQNPPHQHTVRRHGHYITWKGTGGEAQRRGMVLRWKMQYPQKFVGMGHVPLFWPLDELWPQHGEIDCFENFTGSGTWNATELNIHYSQGGNTRLTYNKRNIAVDMTQPHIYAVAWNPGSDDAGTGAYIRGYIDDRMVYNVEWNQTYPTVQGSTVPGTRIIPHGISAVKMNLRLQVEAYNRTDADYTGGLQHFKFFWFQCWSLP
jgi:Big-like domain-containing protein